MLDHELEGSGESIWLRIVVDFVRDTIMQISHTHTDQHPSGFLRVVEPENAKKLVPLEKGEVSRRTAQADAQYWCTQCPLRSGLSGLPDVTDHMRQWFVDSHYT